MNAKLNDGMTAIAFTAAPADYPTAAHIASGNVLANLRGQLAEVEKQIEESPKGSALRKNLQSKKSSLKHAYEAELAESKNLPEIKTSESFMLARIISSIYRERNAAENAIEEARAELAKTSFEDFCAWRIEKAIMNEVRRNFFNKILLVMKRNEDGLNVAKAVEIVEALQDDLAKDVMRDARRLTSRSTSVFSNATEDAVRSAKAELGTEEFGDLVWAIAHAKVSMERGMVHDLDRYPVKIEYAD